MTGKLRASEESIGRSWHLDRGDFPRRTGFGGCESTPAPAGPFPRAGNRSRPPFWLAPSYFLGVLSAILAVMFIIVVVLVEIWRPLLVIIAVIAALAALFYWPRRPPR